MDVPSGAEFVMRDALSKLLLLRYDALIARIGEPEQCFVWHAGTCYQLETEVTWDDRNSASLRMMAAVDGEGKFGSLVPYALDEMVEKPETS